MQLAILSLGVLVFALSVFGHPPLHFDPATSTRLASGAHAAEWRVLETHQRAAVETRIKDANALVAARHAANTAGAETALARLRSDQSTLDAIRKDTGALIAHAAPDAPPTDTNFIFLRFVLATLPAGVIGLVFAAVFAASMNASSAELNALASTTVVDVVKRVWRGNTDTRRELLVSRLITVGWAAFAVLFGTVASRLGSLVEAVNVLGSLFYGTILGIFLTAFLLRRVGGTAVFVAAIVAEITVLACFRFTGISFLWYNLIGCVLVMGGSLVLSLLWPARRLGSGRAA
jgi:hypothetical protein